MFDAKKVLKWIPVVIAAIAAGVQAIDERNKEEQMEDMEKRLTKLENKEES